jgi:hypothetical protein
MVIALVEKKPFGVVWQEYRNGNTSTPPVSICTRRWEPTAG